MTLGTVAVVQVVVTYVLALMSPLVEAQVMVFATRFLQMMIVIWMVMSTETGTVFLTRA